MTIIGTSKQIWIGQPYPAGRRACKEIDPAAGRVRYFLARENKLRTAAERDGVPVYLALDYRASEPDKTL